MDFYANKITLKFIKLFEHVQLKQNMLPGVPLVEELLHADISAGEDEHKLETRSLFSVFQVALIKLPNLHQLQIQHRILGLQKRGL